MIHHKAIKKFNHINNGQKEEECVLTFI